MKAGFRLRPMVDDDIAAADEVTYDSFEDLNRRLHFQPSHAPKDPAVRLARSRIRMGHLVGTDPDGCWVAADEQGIVGAGLSLIRDGVWGLSLLVVHPRAQSSGVGRALLTQTLEYGAATRGAIILSSGDARALHAYGTAGFAFSPTAWAEGVVDRTALPAERGVRQASDADLDLVASVDAIVRGASHSRDIPALLAAGRRWWVYDAGPSDRGYVVADDGSVDLLAATSVAAAQALLWSALAHSAADSIAVVTGIAADQQWATEVVQRAGLRFLPFIGGRFTRGTLGTMSPYLPSGAYL